MLYQTWGLPSVKAKADLVFLLPLVALLLCARHLALKMFRLDVYLSQSRQKHDRSHTVRDRCMLIRIKGSTPPLTHFSTVPLTFFSALSSSSSRSCIFRCRASVVDRLDSPSSPRRLASTSFASDLSRSTSATESLCWREVISCSLASKTCSSVLTFPSAASARSTAASASTRR